MDGKASWKEWGLGMKTLVQRCICPWEYIWKATQRRVEYWGGISLSVLSVPLPSSTPREQGYGAHSKIPGPDWGAEDRERVRIPRKYQPAESSWPLYILKRQHRKTWGKMDTLLYPPSFSFLCASGLAHSKGGTPQTPSRSQLEAEIQPKLPPGKNPMVCCKLCFCSVLPL